MSQEDKNIEKLVAEAKKRFEAIKKAGVMTSSSSLKIGYDAHWIKKNELFGSLGFNNEEEAREAAQVGESTWYSTIRIASFFPDVEEKLFVDMKLSNAKALCDLPESKRWSTEWMRRAAVDSIRDFAAAIEAEMDGKAKESDSKEKSCTLKMPMACSARDAIEAGLKEYGEEIGVEDPSRALELLIAEKSGTTSLVASITNAVQRIKQAKELKDGELSAEEQLGKVHELLDEMALEFADALNGVQNSESQPQEG